MRCLTCTGTWTGNRSVSSSSSSSLWLQLAAFSQHTSFPNIACEHFPFAVKQHPTRNTGRCVSWSHRLVFIRLYMLWKASQQPCRSLSIDHTHTQQTQTQQTQTQQSSTSATASPSWSVYIMQNKQQAVVQINVARSAPDYTKPLDCFLFFVVIRKHPPASSSYLKLKCSCYKSVWLL